LTKNILIGLDIGGTVVRAGAFTPQGELLAVRETPIEAARGPEAGLQRIRILIEETLAGDALPPAAELIGIGIGCTGPLDPLRGTINNPYTLPTWENVPIIEWLRERFNVPITLENDADVAALGEYWMGAGHGVGRLYAITVGTGIGTALIYDGQIYRGLDGSHPDGGHQAIDPSGPLCYCGARGCWESLASGSAIARIAVEAGWTPVGASLRLAPTDPTQITARLVAEAALAGDPLAIQIMEKAAYYFSLGVVNIITLFVPQVIVLSGGVMKSAELFMPALQRAIQQNNVMVPASQVRILPAQLGYYAGLYGAAYTILQKGN
jgi:glucokinase